MTPHRARRWSSRFIVPPLEFNAKKSEFVFRNRLSGNRRVQARDSGFNAETWAIEDGVPGRRSGLPRAILSRPFQGCDLK